MTLFAAILLFAALIPGIPYGYYVLLRWVVSGTSVYRFCTAAEAARKGWMWFFAAAAILFNPIVPIHLDREIWQVIDVLVGICFLLSLSIGNRDSKRDGVGAVRRSTNDRAPNLRQQSDATAYTETQKLVAGTRKESRHVVAKATPSRPPGVSLAHAMPGFVSELSSALKATRFAPVAEVLQFLIPASWEEAKESLTVAFRYPVARTPDQAQEQSIHYHMMMAAKARNPQLFDDLLVTAVHERLPFCEAPSEIVLDALGTTACLKIRHDRIEALRIHKQPCVSEYVSRLKALCPEYWTTVIIN